MLRSEALQNLYQAQDAVRFAQQALEYAQELLRESECDHPDTNGPVCAHCGEFYLSEEFLQSQDDYRVLVADYTGLRDEGFPNLSPVSSLYSYPYPF